jgi:hypothetical protein
MESDQPKYPIYGSGNDPVGSQLRNSLINDNLKEDPGTRVKARSFHTCLSYPDQRCIIIS